MECPAAVQPPKKRIPWIDVLRCIGIFEIYLGHFYTAAGSSYLFVFSHHVQLFFLCAGFLEKRDASIPLKKVWAKKFLDLLLPFFLFSLFSMVLTLINENGDFMACLHLLKGIVGGGVRNHYFVYQLWFLSCLFVISVLFSFIRKLPVGWMLVIGVAAAYGATWIPNSPCLPYNVDSALCYLIYYIIGYATLPVLEKLLADWKRHKCFFSLTGVVSLVYTICLYDGLDLFSSFYGYPVLGFALFQIKPLMVIWILILLSYALRNVSFLRKAGAKTLYLCANEYNVRVLLPPLLGIFGIQLQWTTPLAVMAYCVLLLAFVYKALAPWQERILKRVKQKLRESISLFS